MKKIGFIGLGIMGCNMATNLQKKGYRLTIYNRTKEKATELIRHGAIWANTPKEVAKNSEILITMLSTPEVVQEVALGTNGFLKNMNKGSIWINSSTVNPSFTVKMGVIAQKNHIRYLDAPVAGTRGPAEKGELLFLVGGKTEDIQEASPLFDIMGKKTLSLGKIGNGASIKMLINQLLGQSMVAFTEALIMGEAMGIPKETLFNVLLNTPVVAPVITAIRPKLETNNYEANFPLKWIHKDLHLSSISAYEQEITAPNLNITKEIFAQAKQQGYGELDFTSIYQYLHTKK
ncbi:NAD(P)-dependent oxidoreductase [Aquimarina sp. 2201CG14-23]|nr:NAD(P)-dependent oxidoreductase [Aquimarina sp. 2201CG14-23]MDH7447960.1 NAD(P)-dependent oxidoreductase [Aquimarina sp. 2201CG14-23]